VKINEVKMDQKGKGKGNAKIVVHVVICNLGHVRLSYEPYCFSEITVFFSQQISEQYFSAMAFQRSEHDLI